MENYLRSLGVKKLDYIIATHEDADHIGSLDAVVRDFEVGKVYMPKLPADKTTNTFQDFALAVKSKGLKFDQAKAGISLDLGNNIGATFVGPVKDIYTEGNDYSAVLKLTYRSTSFLFTGDAESASENDMIASGQDLKSTVLKVGHHGSHFSTSEAFLNKVAPKYAVISVGQNSYGHPTAEVLTRLSQHGIQILRTDQTGTIVATSDGSNVTFNTNVAVSSVPTPTPSQANPNVTAQISNPTPTGGKEVVTATVTDSGNPVQGANVTLSVHYKSKTVPELGTTDANGVTKITWSIGSPAKGYAVTVDVVASYGGKSASTQVSFTPQ